MYLMQVRASVSVFLETLADGSVLVFDHVRPELFSGGLQSLISPLLHSGGRVSVVFASLLPLGGMATYEIKGSVTSALFLHCYFS